MDLRFMLMPPLNSEAGTDAMDAMDADICQIAEWLPSVYGDVEATRQAVMELTKLSTLPKHGDGFTCRRAALLFAVAKEPEVASMYAGAFAEDLHRRVLPFIVPRFLRGCAQRPDALVTLTMVLAEMWGGERLGNWPIQPTQ